MNIVKILRTFLLFWKLDILRLKHKFISLLPNQLKEIIRKHTKRAVKMMVAVYVFSVVCLSLLFYSIFKFIILNLNPEELHGLIQCSYLYGVIYILLSVRKPLSRLYRGLYPEDYSILRRAGYSTYSIIAKVAFPIFIQTSIFSFFILGPLIISLILLGGHVLLLVSLVILYPTLFLINFSLVLLLGLFLHVLRGYLERIPGSFLVSIVTIFFSSFLVVYGYFSWYRNGWIIALKSLLQYIQSLQMDKLYFIPTNWLVYGLIDAFNGRCDSVFWGAVLLILSSMIVIAMLFCVHFTFKIRPMGLVAESLSGRARFVPIIKKISSFFPKSFGFVIQKELYGIIRGNSLILAKSKSIFGLVSMFLGGIFGLGFSGSYFKMYQWESLISLYIVFLCISYWFGSGLKPITAVDGEGRSIYHFIRKGININHIFLAKCIVHTFITTTLLILIVICISWVFNLSFHFFLTLLIFGVCIAITTGVIQIGSSAVYPRFNWEHYYEIGYSPKAELLENVFSAVYGILSVQCLAIGFVILHKKYQWMSLPSTLQVVNICIILLSVISIATMLSMIRKHGIKNWEGM